MSNTTSPFVKATRVKLRFNTGSSRGYLQTEDLWDLDLRDLDTLAVHYSELIEPKRKSFLDNPTGTTDKEAELNQIRLDVLKVVMRIRQDEVEAKKTAYAAQRQKEFLNDLVERKRIEGMENMSIEELEKQIEELG